MGFFTRVVDPEESRVSKLHRAVSLAFDHVRTDIHKVTAWVHYFQRKHEEHDAKFDEIAQRIEAIEQHILSMPQSKEDIKSIIDSYYSYDNLHAKIEEINSRISMLETSKPEPQKEVMRQERVSNLKEKIVSKITKNSKDYVKSVIVSMIKKYHSISGPQLKEIVVEEQGLCSKSSFYRLLTELEEDSELSVMQSGKEKNYLIKSPAQQ